MHTLEAAPAAMAAHGAGQTWTRVIKAMVVTLVVVKDGIVRCLWLGGLVRDVNNDDECKRSKMQMERIIMRPLELLFVDEILP